LKWLRRSLAACLIAASAATLASFDACLSEFPKKTPPQVPTHIGQPRELCFDGFAVLHSGRSKTPIFVVERMNRARLVDAQDEERSDRFYEEARLPSAHRARLEDYRGSGYDRGHMAPAADMPTPEAMTQSFSLANMTPQVPDVNRGIWSRNVEKATRKYVMRSQGDVFVFTGAVFSANHRAIGPGRVWVPDYLYKLVYDEADNRAWAHWVENREDARMGKPISYQELVKRTGIEFLPGISPRALGDAVGRNRDPRSACGSKRTCGEMTSCAEARHYLTDCGLSRLDRDGDGVPCEAVCR